MTFELMRKIRRTLRPSNWARFPQVIQIDTNNFCGKRFCGVNCSYCYPMWKIERGESDYKIMPTEYIELILRQIHQYGKDDMNLVDFFLNGDGLTEPRLPELHHYSKKLLPYAITQTFTNGVLTKNYEKLMDLDRICFTISAHNRELYKTVHRGDKFLEALKTLSLVLDHRKAGQRVEVHCVLTKDNILYAQDWWDFFGKNYPDAVRILSPLVASYDNLPSKESMGDYTLEDMEKIVIDVAGAEGRMWTRELIPNGKPCVLWDNLSFSVEGYCLQCCNWSPPEDVNYGNIFNMEKEGYTLRDVWRRRLENRGKNKLCFSCNMKSPQWHERMRRMKVLA
jgi:wyosine [tRNA(Phe)-imidazoG37] synthetase (radical SAM superfamily)